MKNKLKKGFIYSVPLPPKKPFVFEKTDAVKEAEELIREVLNEPNWEFTPRQAFCYDIGYQHGLIDGRL